MIGAGLLAFRVRLDVTSMLLGGAVVVDAYEQQIVGVLRHLSVTISAGKPLASDDLAVKLFKEKGFKWGGDEPEGDPNCFSK